jgi:hypothetical protein
MWPDAARARSKPSHLLQLFGVSSPFHRDLGGGAIDVAEIVRRTLDCSCPDVLLQAMPLRGARDRHNPRLLRQQPGQRDLSRGRLLAFGDAAEQIK